MQQGAARLRSPVLQPPAPPKPPVSVPYIALPAHEMSYTLKRDDRLLSDIVRSTIVFGRAGRRGDLCARCKEVIEPGTLQAELRTAAVLQGGRLAANYVYTARDL